MTTIEKNIPLPTPRKMRGAGPISIMSMADVGDSALFQRYVPTNLLEKKFPGRKFTQRKVEGGIRVWRTK
jgi:hypothetical protein